MWNPSEQVDAKRPSAFSIGRRAFAGMCVVATLLVLLSACSVAPKHDKVDPLAGVVVEEKVSGQTSAKTAESKPVEIRLLSAGDILQHMQVWMSGEREDGSRDYGHFFKHIAGELADRDLKIVNQETPMGGNEFGFSGFPTFNGPQEVGDAEAAAGFNVVLKATNHVMDMGYPGLKNELAFWRSNHPEVAVIGAHDPDDPATSVDDVRVFEKEGFRVALLNYTFDLNGYEDPEGAISLLEEEHVRTTMARANGLADMIVVLAHWGEEYQLEPVESQREWAALFCELGADVIIGGHPHVIEPVELLRAPDGHAVPCFWSVGNFISTSPDNDSLVGGMAKVTLCRDEHGVCSVVKASFVPVVTHLGAGEDMTTYPLYAWTDELAATNMRIGSYGMVPENTSCTREWVDGFCSDVLGDGFDPQSGVYELAM